jgi:hypothetical protein
VDGSNAVLTVWTQPPTIVTQPASQTNYSGTTASFSFTTAGSLPFSYQWEFDGTNLPGATNATLTLTNVQPAQDGDYSVLVTNAYGLAASLAASLTVTPLATNVPVITSFSPLLGDPGSVVVLSGLNFSPVPAANVVYFGAVQAVVTAASPTNLSVVVPGSATFAPITLTVGGLSANSDTPFLPEFPGSGVFTNKSLGSPVTLNVGTEPVALVLADLDGDGKPDLALATSNYRVYVYRNISTNATLAAASFAPPVMISLGAGTYGTIQAADLTGDGRLDLLISDSAYNRVLVLKNLCTPGRLTTNSFGPAVAFPCGAQPAGLAVGDLDGDGKPEIVTANGGNNSVSVLRNVSLPGVITTNSFAPALPFPTGYEPKQVVIADIDGDGKPDLLTVNYNGTGALSVLRNLCAPGSFAFAPVVTFTGLAESEAIAVGDLDGDGKPDVVIGGANSEGLTVFRNTSTPGSITTGSFAAPVEFSAGGWAGWVGIGDLDGDGKPDVVVTSQSTYKMEVFRNTSTPGSFSTSSLAAPISFTSGSYPLAAAIGDVDGDGRPDIIFANLYGDSVSVYQNLMPSRPLIMVQPASTTNTEDSTAIFSVLAGGSAPRSCQWYFAGTNLLAGATNATLVLTNVQPAQAGAYSVLVTNAYGTVLSSNAWLTVLGAPVIVSQPAGLNLKAGAAAAFTVAAAGSAPLSYQWYWNGTNAIPLATNATLTLAGVQVANSGYYSVLVTNVFGAALSSNAVLAVRSLDHFAWNPLSATRFVNVPFNTVITAQNAANGPVTNFTGTVALTASPAVAFSPAVSGVFTQGVWAGTVTVGQTVSNLVLQAADGLGDTGLASAVNIVTLPGLGGVRSGNSLFMVWPTAPAGFVLETAGALNASNWVPVPAAPLSFDDQNFELLPLAGTNAFFRLRYAAP